MTLQRYRVGVVVEKRPGATQWQDHVVRVAAVLPGFQDKEPWSVLREADGVTTYFAGAIDIMVHPGDTKAYKDNVEAPRPTVYVVLRRGAGPLGLRLLMATVDPAEAHAHADVGDDLLEALPMPPQVLSWLQDFVARHHVERRQWRRKRERASAETLAARPPLRQ